MEQYHKNERIRHANSKLGTSVWQKKDTADKWHLNMEPSWDKETTYITNDEYAEVRKAYHDGEQIQIRYLKTHRNKNYHTQDSKYTVWFDKNSNKLYFTLPIEQYRIKPVKVVKVVKENDNITKEQLTELRHHFENQAEKFAGRNYIDTVDAMTLVLKVFNLKD